MDDLIQNVKAAKSGDLAAFGRLFRSFQDMAQAVAYRELQDEDLAQDAVQDAFMEAFLRLPTLHHPAAFPSWFRLVVYKRCSRLKRQRHWAEIPLEIAEAMPGGRLDGDDAASRQEQQRLARHAIAALPEHERLTVDLHYLGGHSLAEISAFLGVAEGTVKKRLHDARQHMKRWVASHGEDYLHAQRRRWTEAMITRMEQGRILFVGNSQVLPPAASGCSNAQLYTLNTDGSDLQAVGDPGTYVSPQWSPDGSQIYFGWGGFVGRRLSSQLCRMNADGSGFEELSPDLAIGQMRLSPEGSRVVFHSDKDQPELPDFVRGEIYTMNADEWSTSVVRLTHNQIADLYPEWTPEGRVIFSRYLRGGTASWGTAMVGQLFVANLDGNGEVPFPPDGPPVYANHARYSPDGTRIAYLVSRDQPNAQNVELWLMDADGSNRSQWLDFGVGMNSLNWSPDGQKLFFTSHYHGVRYDSPEYDNNHPECSFYFVDAQNPPQTRPEPLYPGVRGAGLADWGRGWVG